MTVGEHVRVDPAPPELVTLTWTSGPPGPVAREILDAAARADAGMTFGRAAGDGLYRRVFATALVYTRLRRWSAPRSAHPIPAAVITVRGGGDRGLVVDATVHPEFRSTGVLTASVEDLQRRPPPAMIDGTLPIIVCAYGSHPAALRAAHGFGATIGGRRDVLVLPDMQAYLRSRAADGKSMRAVEVGSVPVTSRHAHVLSHVDGPQQPVHYAATCPATGAISGWFTVDWAAPHHGDSESYCTATQLTVVAADPGCRDERAALAETISAALSTAWCRSTDPPIEAVTAADDAVLTEALRAAAFEHDRTDVVFRAGTRWAPDPRHLSDTPATTAPAQSITTTPGPTPAP